MGKICFEKREVFNYPDRSTYYNPSSFYPEYIWGKSEVSDQKNMIYDMMRNCFLLLGMDRSNYGNSGWNPLGDIIITGDTVLIKPNLVYHINDNPLGDLDCMVTHPSIIRCVIDYCIIALKGSGKIIIGDAPVQSCNFNTLMVEGGYIELIDFYRRKGIELEIEDFRDTISVWDKGSLISKKRTSGENDSSILIDLGSHSFFCRKPKEKNDYRIADYYHQDLIDHHHDETHEYLINKAALKANVILNLAKPKMHRKSGFTGAMKNFIGICSQKEYLPHYVQGSVLSGGDEYYGKNIFKECLSRLSDRLNYYRLNKQTIKEKSIYKIMGTVSLLNRCFYNDAILGGGWYGNDTLWRTVLDINLILKYCDDEGVFNIERGKAREIFNIGDMIVAGQGEGPLTPSPKKMGIISMSNDPVSFDQFFFKFTGFNYEKIPLIKYACSSELLNNKNDSEIMVFSNIDKYNEVVLDGLEIPAEWILEPSNGWKEAVR